MCDTLCALGDTTASGLNMFAKNSDRHPNEPQYFVYIPAADHTGGEALQCTYIAIKQVARTHAVILSKPAWMWGGEMGTNEFGVTIGNEALWTKMPDGPPALMGMDLLRLGLERGKTAAEALDVIIDLLGEYGQGGDCGFDGEDYYHNAFMIMDADGAYVLETTGPFWAVEKVQGIRSISNVLSIDQYDRIHPEAIGYAVSQGWCESAEGFHFRTTFLDHFHRMGMGATLRGGCTARTLEKRRGSVDQGTLKRALRNHNGNEIWTGSGYSAPCMHASMPSGCQSTNSMTAELRAGGHSLYYGTGMSTPCIAPFVPFWFDAYSDQVVFAYDNQAQAVQSWLHREGINRAMVAGKLDEELYHRELAALEADWDIRLQEVQDQDAAVRKAFCNKVADEEQAFVDRWVKLAEAAAANPRGDREFQDTWAHWNGELGTDHRIFY